MATTEKDIIKEYPKTKEIADLIVGLGNKLKVDPMYLARTMNAETGGTFSPSKRNTAGSGATGLIQFTKETARNLGTTTQALSKMSAREQMSFVERYFSSIGAGNLARLRNGSQHDVNMAIFYPRAIGKGFNFNIAEDIRRTQSRGAANRFMKQNKGIKKAGDYTMKLTPPLPRLKPSENKKAIKIIEKSKEKELSSEEEKFLKDIKRQDPKSFMDMIKSIFIRGAGASERRIYPLSPDDEPNRTAQQMEDLFSEKDIEKAELDPDADKQTPTSPINQLSFKLPSKKDSDKIVDDMNLPPERSLSATIQRLIEKDPEFREQFKTDPKETIIDRLEQRRFGDDLEIGTGDAINRFDVNREALRERLFQLPIPTDVKSPAGANLLPNIASMNQDLPEGKESDDISYALVDRFDDATEIGYGQLNRLDRNLEPRERSETGNMFADEPMPMGGEADPRDERDDVIINFNEGGEVKADFDGKDDEEEPADPPPLAKPKEVADDIPALLSEGEDVLPANVVRYLGVERIIEMHRRVLAEIQQMEDLGMIQNVDENGEPEQDDTEMKFAEGEDPEEGVTKGTIIIASAKPKGMMCPDPIMMQGGGGMGSQDDQSDPDPMGGMGEPGAEAPGPDTGKGDSGPDYSQGFPSIEEKLTEEQENLDRSPGTFGGFTDLDEDFFTSPERGTGSVADIAEQGMYGLGKFGEDVLGIEITGKRAAEREASEKDMGQPGDSDFEFKEPEKITEDEIKVDQVIEDLQSKNVYIEGVGYIPLASLMSPRDDIVV